jgi:hypothetical protein
VPARPGFIGGLAWVRSSAWACDFSSMHSTTALSGGLRYNPTTSTSFSSNRGSVLTLNVSTKCGLSPSADQIPCTDAGETPTRVAMPRTDQCVAPSGVVWVVNRTICAIFSGGIDGFGPRPLATSPNLVNPSTSNCLRHANTVGRDTSHRSAISTFETPSAGSSRT